MARFAFTLGQIALRASSRWLAAYELALPALKRPCIDRLNAEMGAPAETPVPWRAWSAFMSGGPRPRETPCRARLDGPLRGGASCIETLLRRHEVCNARFAVLLVGL